jgi:superfamily II DNA/RNA helicase
MENFENLGLCKALNTSLNKMGFKKPTPIQAQAIPLIIEGRDLLGSASTGTGKTGAFAIPVIDKIISTSDECALIITPTRELAKQVVSVVRDLLGQSSQIKASCLIGGEAISKQLSQLKRKPRIIIGTPGRINDHLERGSLGLKNVTHLVLDETDRMLDMGFGIQIDQILKFMPQKKQTLMFSATFPKNIITLSKKYLKNPERISVDKENTLSKNIKHEIINTDNSKKYKLLIEQLEKREGSILVFAKTKHSTEKIAKNLKKDGIKAGALNGDLRQSKRDKIMRSFREKKIRVLIATDIASRGLDVPHLKHVINYDLPQVAEDYIHRIGRTARAGESGEAICFVSPSEGHLWLNIDMLMNPNAKHQYAPRKNTSSRSRRRKAGSSNGKSFSDKPKRKSKAGSSNGKSFSDKPKRKSKAGPSKRTIRSSDAKPKKRFYAAKKKSKK